MDSVQRRRAEISKMVKQGVPTTEIARKMKLPIFVVRADRIILSSPAPKPATLSPVKTISFSTIDERREAIREMHLRGMDDPSIAEALGLSKTTVWRERGAIGVRPHKSPENMQKRIAEVKRLAEDGLNIPEIAKELGIAIMTVRRDFERAGFQLAHPDPDERRRKVQALLKRGETVPSIASALGTSKMTVYRDIKALEKVK